MLFICPHNCFMLCLMWAKLTSHVFFPIRECVPAFECFLLVPYPEHCKCTAESILSHWSIRTRLQLSFSPINWTCEAIVVMFIYLCQLKQSGEWPGMRNGAAHRIRALECLLFYHRAHGSEGPNIPLPFGAVPPSQDCST